MTEHGPRKRKAPAESPSAPRLAKKKIKRDERKQVTSSAVDPPTQTPKQHPPPLKQPTASAPLRQSARRPIQRNTSPEQSTPTDVHRTRSYTGQIAGKKRPREDDNLKSLPVVGLSTWLAQKAQKKAAGITQITSPSKPDPQKTRPKPIPRKLKNVSNEVIELSSSSDDEQKRPLKRRRHTTQLTPRSKLTAPPPSAEVIDLCSEDELPTSPLPKAMVTRQTSGRTVATSKPVPKPIPLPIPKRPTRRNFQTRAIFADDNSTSNPDDLPSVEIHTTAASNKVNISEREPAPARPVPTAGKDCENSEERVIIYPSPNKELTSHAHEDPNVNAGDFATPEQDDDTHSTDDDEELQQAIYQSLLETDSLEENRIGEATEEADTPGKVDNAQSQILDTAVVTYVNKDTQNAEKLQAILGWPSNVSSRETPPISAQSTMLPPLSDEAATPSFSYPSPTDDEDQDQDPKQALNLSMLHSRSATPQPAVAASPVLCAATPDDNTLYPWDADELEKHDLDEAVFQSILLATATGQVVGLPAPEPGEGATGSPASEHEKDNENGNLPASQIDDVSIHPQPNITTDDDDDDLYADRDEHIIPSPSNVVFKQQQEGGEIFPLSQSCGDPDDARDKTTPPSAAFTLSIPLKTPLKTAFASFYDIPKYPLNLADARNPHTAAFSPGLLTQRYFTESALARTSPVAGKADITKAAWREKESHPVVKPCVLKETQQVRREATQPMDTLGPTGSFVTQEPAVTGLSPQKLERETTEATTEALGLLSEAGYLPHKDLLLQQPTERGGSEPTVEGAIPVFTRDLIPPITIQEHPDSIEVGNEAGLTAKVAFDKMLRDDPHSKDTRGLLPVTNMVATAGMFENNSTLAQALKESKLILEALKEIREGSFSMTPAPIHGDVKTEATSTLPLPLQVPPKRDDSFERHSAPFSDRVGDIVVVQHDALVYLAASPSTPTHSSLPPTPDFEPTVTCPHEDLDSSISTPGQVDIEPALASYRPTLAHIEPVPVVQVETSRTHPKFTPDLPFLTPKSDGENATRLRSGDSTYAVCSELPSESHPRSLTPKSDWEIALRSDVSTELAVFGVGSNNRPRSQTPESDLVTSFLPEAQTDEEPEPQKRLNSAQLKADSYDSSIATSDDSPSPATPTTSSSFDTSQFYIRSTSPDDDISPEVYSKILDIPTLPPPETDDDDEFLLSHCFDYPDFPITG